MVGCLDKVNLREVAEIDNVVSELKKIPTWKGLMRETKISERTFTKYLGQGKGCRPIPTYAFLILSLRNTPILLKICKKHDV